MTGPTTSPSRPVSIDNADAYNGRQNRKAKIPWVTGTHLLVSSLQMLILVYAVGKWDRINASNHAEPPVDISTTREIDQNLIKGWHETLNLLKNSDETNTRLREQIDELEKRLAEVEAAKPAPVIGPLTQQDSQALEQAKE